MNLYPWQIRALDQLQGKSGVLSAPTGSGKTLVAYCWAGLLDQQGVQQNPTEEKIIFTAPIKALSNERYLELGRLGFDAGIETGDFKKNPDASVICCTQEIYNLKYAGQPNLKVVIDEFHYIFEDHQRARAYIDGIRKTHQDVPMLVMSATFGKSELVCGYLQQTAGRSFELVDSSWRATGLEYVTEGVTGREIHDALVFVFSQRGTWEVADLIALERKPFDRARAGRLRDLAWILGVDRIRNSMFKGVGVYHGSLLPKEKLFVERAYRERILDVVVGTDALALGVNLPAERVVFAQLVKYHDRKPLTKMAFEQMGGRAGRKGLYERGYVTYLEDSPAESRGVETGQIFKALVAASPEHPSVQPDADYSALLKGERTVDQEAEYIARASLPQRRESDTRLEIKMTLQAIAQESENRCPQNAKGFQALLADLWYSEMNLEQNLAMAELFFTGGTPNEGYSHPSGMQAAAVLRPWERNDLQALLRVKRFHNNLTGDYRLVGMDTVDRAIVQIDSTVFGFEDKIDEMEATQPDLPQNRLRLTSLKEKEERLKRHRQRKTDRRKRRKAGQKEVNAGSARTASSVQDNKKRHDRKKRRKNTKGA